MKPVLHSRVAEPRLLRCGFAGLALAVTLATPFLRAADFQLSFTTAAAGTTAGLPVTVANAGTNLSAFAFYLATSPALRVPSVTAGPAQPNLVCFVDNFSNGVACVTGFVLNGAPIGNGPVATLSWAVPPGIAPGTYPVTVHLTPPSNAIPGPNPEARSLAGSELIPSTAANGAITVTAPAPPIVGPHRLPDGKFQFSFTGTMGVGYTVHASTNLLQWAPLGPPTALGGGAFSFTDPDAGQFALRFYRLSQP